MAPLSGRVALVTGAARRLGRAISLAVAQAGADLVLHHHASDSEAEELRRELIERKTSCWLVRADLGDAAEVEGLVERARLLAGRPITLLVNNAAIFPVDSLATLSVAELQRCLAINTWAPLALCRAFAGQTPQGQIVNLLDEKIAGYRFSNVGYQLSKHSLELLTRMLAIELAPGICVNAVAPGLILPPPGQGAEWLERRARAAVPLARPGTPDDVADAVVFLLGSSFLTGQTVFVDGGQHLLEPGDGSHPH